MSNAPGEPDTPGGSSPDAPGPPESGVNDTVAVGRYTWTDFLDERGFGADIIRHVHVDGETGDDGSGGLLTFVGSTTSVGPERDWEAAGIDPATWLGFHPVELDDRLESATAAAADVRAAFASWIEETPVRKGEYTWEHYKWDSHYEDGYPPVRDGKVLPFDPDRHLGFPEEELETRLEVPEADDVRSLLDRRTVNVRPTLDEDAFFSTPNGHTTLVNRYDLEKAVDVDKKGHFFEVERYWVDKPYAFVVIFHSLRENEKKYFVVSPYRNEIETDLAEFLSGKLRTRIKYSNKDLVVSGSEEDRRAILEEETRRLLNRYDLLEDSSDLEESPMEWASRLMGDVEPTLTEVPPDRKLDGLEARPEPAVLAEDPGTLTEYQVQKLLYLLKRNFLGYERIDGIKHDINVEDISCDGYNSRVFVYHTEYENLITNIEHGETDLDDFVVKLAQRSGKGISQRRPQVDATLPDGSRAQLTLGRAVSGHGTNYTIRQFKDVPFTPVDLINWNTFSLDQMAYFWLCIENERSLIFAGGTASGKTTSLNACSLFIPNNTKIVSIEDTREVELPQRNWVASVTRPSFGTSDKGDVDEFDLLEAALRQRPDYIVMGEVRGEEGRTLFQVMSTGHTTLTTFHADDVGEVLKRFTTDPINVSKTLFTSLDLVTVQTATRVQGRKVRRNKTLTEINHYDTDNDEINVQDVYQWSPEADEYEPMGRSNTLEKIKFDNGWNQATLEQKLLERRAVLAYLVVNDINEFANVAATLQGFANDPETVLTLIAEDRLPEHLEDLQQMENVLIDVDPKQEELVPRPEPSTAIFDRATETLERAEAELFPQYRGRSSSSLAEVLADMSEAEDVVARPDQDERLADMFHGASLFHESEEPTPESRAAGDGGSDPAVDGSDDATAAGADTPADAVAGDDASGEPAGDDPAEGDGEQPDQYVGDGGVDADADGPADAQPNDGPDDPSDDTQTDQ